MDPRDFHRLASGLVNTSSAPEIRTAISRAYYATYNVGVEILEELGFPIPRGPGGHGEVQNRLGNSGDGEIEKVASMLSDLHSRRIQADYRLQNRQIENQKTAEGIVRQAGGMIQVLDSCRNEPRRTTVFRAIREWERKISARPS